MAEVTIPQAPKLKITYACVINKPEWATEVVGHVVSQTKTFVTVVNQRDAKKVQIRRAQIKSAEAFDDGKPVLVGPGQFLR